MNCQQWIGKKVQTCDLRVLKRSFFNSGVHLGGRLKTTDGNPYPLFGVRVQDGDALAVTDGSLLAFQSSTMDLKVSPGSVIVNLESKFIFGPGPPSAPALSSNTIYMDTDSLALWSFAQNTWTILNHGSNLRGGLAAPTYVANNQDYYIDFLGNLVYVYLNGWSVLGPFGQTGPAGPQGDTGPPGPGGGGGDVTSVNGQTGAVVIPTPGQETVKLYNSGGGPYDLGVDGLYNNVVVPVAPGPTDLALPGGVVVDGTSYRVINNDVALVRVIPGTGHAIEGLAVNTPLELAPDGGKTTLLFVQGVWNLV